MDAAKIKGEVKSPIVNKVGEATWAQVEEIAKDKMFDLNAFTLKSASEHGGRYSPQHGINRGKKPLGKLIYQP